MAGSTVKHRTLWNAVTSPLHYPQFLRVLLPSFLSLEVLPERGTIVLLATDTRMIL